MNIPTPDPIKTERLTLRVPQLGDGARIFDSYASDREVVRYMSWPRHESVEVSEQVVDFWIREWSKGRGGALLITHRGTDEVIGSTGLNFETPFRATTGYILNRASWGKGYASEVLRTVVELAKQNGAHRLYAYCHHQHERSANVMLKCGFGFEGVLRKHMEFPNLEPGHPLDVGLYAWIRDGT